MNSRILTGVALGGLIPALWASSMGAAPGALAAPRAQNPAPRRAPLAAKPAPVSLSYDRLPYARAGLSATQAAAHLLDRFAFGARPGDVERVVALGLERWLSQQLAAPAPGPEVERRLAEYSTLTLSPAEVVQRYPNNGQLLRAALDAGVITQAEYQKKDRVALKDRLAQFAQQQGYGRPQELLAETTAQKLIRAVYGEDQLQEALSDFWFNHFNVSWTDNKARLFIPSYERDAIRPHTLGRFRDLLEATAKHPAMLYYLNNAESTAPMPDDARMQLAADTKDASDASATSDAANAVMTDNAAMTLNPAPPAPGRRKALQNPRKALQNPKKTVKKAARGINENYARELMELHTLGVDGGYTQRDVIEVARALTGWTVLPPGPRGNALQRRLARQGSAQNLVVDGLFVFRPDMHDTGAKTVLGQAFPAGGGMEEGERVLDLVANHPATIRHITHQIAVRFVSDTPPKALEDRLARVFSDTHGDLRAVVRALAYSPEFWSSSALRAKVKSPFELAASALRALDADVINPRPVVQWITRMGQPLYAYQPPTGYPDSAKAWVNTGSLLNRMNFGLQLACGRVPGVRLDLLKLNGGHEPESAQAALKTYAPLLLPGRDLTDTLRQLAPVVNDPEFVRKVDAAAPKPAAPGAMTSPDETSTPSNEAMVAPDDAMAPTDAMTAPDTMTPASDSGAAPAARRARRQTNAIRRPNGQASRMNGGGAARRALRNAPAPTQLAEVVGVLLGSPEFQRR